jgi:hypothetical protein
MMQKRKCVLILLLFQRKVWIRLVFISFRRIRLYACQSLHCTFQIDKNLSRKRVAHHGVPFQLNLSHKSTVPQPFSFEDRDKSRMAQKKQVIEHYLEEEKKVRMTM